MTVEILRQVSLHRPAVMKLCQNGPNLMIAPIHNQIVRFKSKKNKPVQSTSESTEDKTSWEEEISDKNTKTMQVTVKSMRVDGLLKASLGIARNKIETLFYESKIRVNGEKLLKKSATAVEGDEIDIIKSVNPENPNHLIVARVEVLEVSEKGDNLGVKIRRCKSITIENYDKPK